MIPARQFATVSRWLHNSPPGTRAPGHVQSAIDQLERHQQAEQYWDEQHQAGARRLSREEVQDHLAELEGDLSGRAERRRAEQALAARIAEHAAELHRPDLDELSRSLAECRTEGVAGVGEGGHQVAWDHKCGQVRLCPDESREETQRVAEWYVPAITEWVQAKATRRVFYVVFTEHNYRRGGLRGGKRHQFARFKDVMQGDVDASPVLWRTVVRNGEKVRETIPQRKRKLPRFPGLKGALVIQEDPLSADREWNVHLNAFLLWEGPCDFKQLRQEWGANLHIRQIKPNGLVKAVLEAVKYSAQIVPTKSADKLAKRQTEAPAMTEWAAGEFAEWWDAQRGFRRLRSYGCLYALHRRKWDAARPERRAAWIKLTSLSYDLAQLAWADLMEPDRVQLRKAMEGRTAPKEPPDMAWVAAVGWDRHGAGSYSVTLIPGNNFGSSGAKTNRFGAFEAPDWSPPPPH